ncbi:MAG: YtxH domain-containing protein, partial [Chloroflexi bacterium]|nr:YtxH domain-containing protein [Chloroflexota bacterium]
IVGACAAIVLAPEPGEETRARLRRATSELRAKAQEAAERARQRVSDLVGQLDTAIVEGQKQRAVDLLEQIKAAIAEGQEAAAKAREEILERFESARRSQDSS